MSTPPFYTEQKITKIFRDRVPNSTGLCWCLRWTDGHEEYTIDSASGPSRFTLLRELQMHLDDLDEILKRRYLKLETQKGYIRK